MKEFKHGADKVLKKIKWYSKDDILKTASQGGIEAEDHFEFEVELVQINKSFLFYMNDKKQLGLDVN